MIRSKVPSAMFGKMLAHYRIIEQDGSGGMGVVYRARDETLRRDVALKILAPGTEEASGKGRERLLRAARACSALNHPKICTIYEVGEFNQEPRENKRAVWLFARQF
jgi:serine/threonine protein kinase